MGTLNDLLSNLAIKQTGVKPDSNLANYMRTVGNEDYDPYEGIGAFEYYQKQEKIEKRRATADRTTSHAKDISDLEGDLARYEALDLPTLAWSTRQQLKRVRGDR